MILSIAMGESYVVVDLDLPGPRWALAGREPIANN